MKTLRARLARPARAAVRPPEPAIEFNAFIAYDNVAAARDAMSTVGEVLRAAPRPHRLCPMLWRCAQLENARWEETALRDAAAADVVVLALAARTPLSPALEAWVTRLLAKKRGSRVTVVALLGRDDAWTISIEVPATRPVSAEIISAHVAALPAAQPVLASRAA